MGKTVFGRSGCGTDDGAAAAMATASKLFVYGTLLAPEVLQGLLRRVPDHQPALLHGFSRWAVAAYPTIPAIIQTAGGSVSGHLLESLSEREMRALDFYEDDGYERLVVEVLCRGDGFVSETVEAFAYVWPSHQAGELAVGESWSYEAFRDERLERFVADVVLPCRDDFEAQDARGSCTAL